MRLPPTTRRPSAYATLEQQARTFDAQLTNCRSSGTSAALTQCFESNDAHFATELQSYSNTVSSIDYPSDVSADVAQVQTAVGQASATLTRLSQVGSDLTSYLSAAASSNIASELNNVTTTTESARVRARVGGDHDGVSGDSALRTLRRATRGTGRSSLRELRVKDRPVRACPWPEWSLASARGRPCSSGIGGDGPRSAGGPSARAFRRGTR